MAKRDEQPELDPISEAEPIKHSAKDVFGDLVEAQEYLKYLGPIVGLYNTLLGTAVGLVVGTGEVVTSGWLEFRQTRQRAELRAKWQERQKEYQDAMIEAQASEEKKRAAAKAKVEEIRRTWEFIYLDNLAKLKGPIKAYYGKVKKYEEDYFDDPDVAAWSRLVALRLMVFTVNLAFDDIGMEGRMRITATGETIMVLPPGDDEASSEEDNLPLEPENNQ